MKNKFTIPICLILLCVFSPHASFSQYWSNEVGGIYNIPAIEYNPTYWGYGSDGDDIYNKIDLRNGNNMEITSTSPMYDYLGNQVATAWTSVIGWNHATDFRDGGIIASSIAKVKVGNTIHTMVYAWSVNTQEGGRQSGWIKLSDLSPSSTIENILNDNKTARMQILRDGGIDNATYEEHNIVSAVLPSWAEEYYLVPDRDASYTAGKAKYYYTRDGLISGLKNIPETNRQRYGVANNNIPFNAKFYRDMGISRVNVAIYPPSSTTAINHSLRLVWGYTITSAGEKIYSWINERTLSSTGVTINEFVPDPNLEYYIDNDHHNIRLASTGASEDAYCATQNNVGVNVRWKFVAKGNGDWHIQRSAGGSKPRLRSDNSAFADMQATSSSGVYTYFHFPKSTTSGAHYISLPDGPSSYRRLQVNNASQVKMVSDASSGTFVSFTFREAPSSGARIGGSDEPIEAFLEETTAFSVYPNPSVDGKVNISMPNLDSTLPVTASLFTLEGRKVQETTFRDGGEMELNIGSMKGLFLLRVVQGDFIRDEKVLFR